MKKQNRVRRGDALGVVLETPRVKGETRFWDVPCPLLLRGREGVKYK